MAVIVPDSEEWASADGKAMGEENLPDTPTAHALLERSLLGKNS